MKDVARLAPLPSSDDPFIVFLGVGQDGKTAVFLVASDAAVTGDGRCKPAGSDCQTIELKSGETAYFDLDLGNGAGVKQFQLDLLSVKAKASSGDAKAAAASRHRESATGRKLLRTMIDADEAHIDELDYDAKTGKLTHRKGAGSTAASVGGPVDAGYAVAIHAGGGDRPRVEMDLARLTPLKGAENAFVVYLGVLADGKTAVFLNSFRVPVTGGACKPSPEECQIIEVAPGQTAVVDLDPGEGRLDYPITVDTVTPRKAQSTDAAAKLRGTESAAGREFLRDGLKAGVLDLDGLRFDAATGTLVR